MEPDTTNAVLGGAEGDIAQALAAANTGSVDDAIYALHSDADNTWRDYYDESLNYAQNFRELYKRCVAFDDDFLYDIVATYAVCNTKTLKTCPILLFHGDSGTGKSLSSDMIACYREQQQNVIGASSTFASIRNQLNELRWHIYDPEVPNYSLHNERSYLLVWADIKEIFIDTSDGKVFALLRNGFSRSEDKVMIAGERGKNIAFYVFGAKVISTTENFFTRVKYAELLRRLLVVQCKHLKFLPPHRLEQWQALAHIDPYQINWHGIHHEYNDFWTPARIHTMVAILRRKASIKKDVLANYPNFDEHKFKTCFELMASGIACELYDLPTAKRVWNEYWGYFTERVGLGKDALHQRLEEVVAEEISRIESQNNELLVEGMEPNPYHIPAKAIATAANALAKNKAAYSDPKTVREHMADLGWISQTVGGKTVWIRKSDLE